MNRRTWILVAISTVAGLFGFFEQMQIQKMLVDLRIDGGITMGMVGKSLPINSSNSSILSIIGPTKSAIKIAQLTNELARSDVRYYVYDDPLLERKNLVQAIKKAGKTRYQTHEVFFEIHTIETLQSHSRRVYDPALADIYVVPMAAGAMMYAAGKKFPVVYKESVEHLLQHPIFKSTMGHRHILFAMPVPQYTCVMFKSLRTLQMHTFFPALWNVTVVDDKDWNGLATIRDRKLAAGHDYETGFQSGWYPLARHSFSMGLYAEKSIPIVPASYEKFKNASYEVFYHSRTSGSLFNSTQYRHAPFRPEVMAAMNGTSSIGHDLEYDEWLRRFTDSKFCLAIRGDTPHSHALSRAVKVGCIPVIISDFWPLYSPTLRHFVALEDFSIVLDEKAFLKNPLRELRKLNDLPQNEIQEKLDWLAFAQRLFFAEHPDSLFVEAFISQALHASHIELGGPKFVNHCKK